MRIANGKGGGRKKTGQEKKKRGERQSTTVAKTLLRGSLYQQTNAEGCFGTRAGRGVSGKAKKNGVPKS